MMMMMGVSGCPVACNVTNFLLIKFLYILLCSKLVGYQFQFWVLRPLDMLDIKPVSF